MYNLSLFVGQESRCCFTECLWLRFQSRCWLGCNHVKIQLGLENRFQACSCGCGSIRRSASTSTHSHGFTSRGPLHRPLGFLCIQHLVMRERDRETERERGVGGDGRDAPESDGDKSHSLSVTQSQKCHPTTFAIFCLLEGNH